MEKMSSHVSGLLVYDGSSLLQPLSDRIGLPLDQVNFLVCQLVVLLLGFPYRTVFGPHNVSPTTRHLLQVLIGVPLTYFCFGSQIIHYLVHSVVCLVLMKTLRPGVMEKAVFTVALGYLAVCHIYRIIYDYGGYTLDITGPLMVNTQRLSSLAFSLRDGSVKDESKLSKVLRQHAIKKSPSLLEFFSYTFSFHGMMCGPFCFYNDFIAFIEGTNYTAPKSQNNVQHRSKPAPAPSPLVVVIKKSLTVAFLGGMTMLVVPRFPGTYLRESSFFELNAVHRMVYIMIMTTLVRMRYYFGWKLGETINVNAGLGYNGKDENDNDRWDLIDNANILKVECCTSLKILLDNWNIGTTLWLRYVVYERLHSTLAVFLFSAIWHGFYLGYYLTFMGGALFISAGRMMRRKVRPYFQVNKQGAFVYDVITFIGTRIAIAYLTYPFVLLELLPSLYVYWSLYYGVYHIVVIMAMVACTFIPSQRTGSTAQSQPHLKAS